VHGGAAPDGTGPPHGGARFAGTAGSAGSYPALLVLATFVAAAVFGSRPLISYKALALGAGTVEIGLVASAFALFAILASIPVGRLVDRTGERPIVLTGTLVIAVGCLVALLAPSTTWLAVSQSALGLGQLMVVVGSHAVLAYRGDTARRDERIAVYVTFVSVGHSAGPGLAGVLADPAVIANGQAVFFTGAISAALVAAVLASRLPSGPGRLVDGGSAPASAPSMRRTLSRLPMRQALAGSIATLAAIDLLIAYLPVFGTERGLAPTVIGIMLGTLGLSQLVSRLFMARLIRAFGHVRILLGAMALPALLIPLLAVLTQEPLLVLLMVPVGLSLGLGQPMTLALVAGAADPGGQGLAMGMRLAGNRFGQLTIPVLVGATAGQLGASGIMIAVGGILGAASVYLVGRGAGPGGGQPHPRRDPAALQEDR
jgi:MFS family permease